MSAADQGLVHGAILLVVLVILCVKVPAVRRVVAGLVLALAWILRVAAPSHHDEDEWPRRWQHR